MIDKILAILALLTVIAFLGVLVVFVPEVDLIIVILLVTGLASYDFWRTFRNRSRNGGGSP